MHRSVLLTLVAPLCFLGCGEEASVSSAVDVAFENDLGMQFVEIPAGEFQMGSEETHYPLLQVRMSSFYMMTTEVTYGQYDNFKVVERIPPDATDQHPVVDRPRAEFVEFMEWLSERDGRQYQFPSEAQWEYAARGGTVGQNYHWGNRPSHSKANLRKGIYHSTVAVASYPPNQYGLYDMIGNASEMVYEDYLNFRYPYDYPGYEPGVVLQDPVGLGFTSYDGGEIYSVRGKGLTISANEIWYRSSSSDRRLEFVGLRLLAEAE